MDFAERIESLAASYESGPFGEGSKDSLEQLRETLAGQGEAADRSNMLGHVTASLLVVSPDGGSVLLIDHKGLGKKLPPGGHLDPGEMPIEAALREAAEETGIPLEGLSMMEGVDLLDGLVDIDSHPIPANPRKGEGPHRHHDFCFVRRASSLDLPQVVDEGVAGRAWVPVEEWLRQGDPRARVLARAAGLSGKFGQEHREEAAARAGPKL